jgi:hypothetical protein
MNDGLGLMAHLPRNSNHIFNMHTVIWTRLYSLQGSRLSIAEQDILSSSLFPTEATPRLHQITAIEEVCTKQTSYIVLTVPKWPAR